MILKKLKLTNFRAHKNFEVDFDEEMNVIIGKNDIGKSTILEALEIFFNSDKIEIEIEDLCIFADEPKMSISCCFDVGDGEILIDSTNFTNLHDEFLLNKDGCLEIKKIWDCSNGKITKSSLKTYIVAIYPSYFSPPLVLDKIPSLQKRYEKYSDPVYIPSNRTVAAELRKAIYLQELPADPECVPVEIDIAKDNAKAIGEPLLKQLPQFFLFKSDRKNTDKDSEIQDPLKAITKSVLGSMTDEIQALQEKIKSSVESIGRRTIEKLAELNETIANDITPNVTLKPLDSSFVFELVSDNGIPLNKRGSGVRRLILLSYFRAEAETSIADDPKRQLIYAIEEPETSQHPDYQRMIFDTLNELSHKPTHQIIVTSHTPEIAKMVSVDQLIFLRRLADNTVVVENDEEEKVKHVVADLGILPYASTRTVVYVEGKNDVSFLTNINQGIPELRELIDLKQTEIPIIAMQGSHILDWIGEDYFKNSNVKEIYITDRDDKKYVEKVNEICQANDGRRYAWYTNRTEMENYVPRERIEEEFDISLEEYKDEWETRDVPDLLKNKCLLNIEDSSKREKNIKQIINGSISKKLTKTDFERIGAWDEVYLWFRMIRDINNGTYRQKAHF